MGLSVGFGVGLGLLYGLASYANFAWAMRRAGTRFLAIAFGGIIVRMTVAFALVLWGVLVLDVQGKPFFLAFMTTFALALAFEVFALHRGLGIASAAGEGNADESRDNTDKD